MIYDIIIDTLLFGATGYITNKYVLNMLFKEYPFLNNMKIGGKVKASKNQFVKNVSAMMENDIINAEKISEKFNSHDFNEEFVNFSKDFFNDCICRDIKNLRLKDIPVFYDACCSLRDVAINLINVNVGDVLQNIGTNIKLSEFISKNQVDHISKNIIQNIILTIKNTDIIDDVIHESFDAFRNVKINDIITKNISKIIKNNVEKESLNFNNIIRQNLDERIESTIDNIFNQNNVLGILKEMQETISQNPLKFYLNINPTNILKHFQQNLIEFFRSEKGEKAISDMYYDLKNYIINSNVSFLNIYKKDYEKAIKERIDGRLNNIAYSVLKWIGNNSEDLDNTIEESIDEIISGHSELKNKIFLTIKDYFNSKKNDDERAIKILLESEVNDENLDKISSFITSNVSNYLSSKNAKVIINTLEDKNIFNVEILVNSIIKYIKYIDDNTMLAFFDSLLSMPINNFIDINLVKIFNDKLKYIFIDYIKQNTYYSEEINTEITYKVNEYIFKNFNDKFSEFIDEEYIQYSSDKIKKLLLKNIDDNKTNIIKNINLKINDLTANHNISDLFEKLSENGQALDIIASEKITELIHQNFLHLVDDIGDAKVNELFTKISSIPDIHNSMSDFMKNIVGESIAVVTEDYISESIEKHFDKLDDTEFVKYIKDSNLIDEKKNKNFGGTIGVAVGLPISLVSASSFSSTIINNVFSWQGMALGSIIGLATNFIAMNPFSKFREESSILAKIPILKNINRESIGKKQLMFANYMADLIDNNLIVEENVQDLVQSKSIQLKRNINNTISDDNHKQLYEFFDNNKEYLSKRLSVSSKDVLTKNVKSVSKYISDNIANIPIRQLINRNLIDGIMDFVNSKKTELINGSFDYIKKNILEKLSILNFIPEKLLDQITEEVHSTIDDKFDKHINCLKDLELLKEYLLKHEDRYKEFLEQPLTDIISHNVLDDLYYSIFNKLYSHLFAEDKLDYMSDEIYQSLNKEFNRDKKLDSLLDRKNKFLLNSMFFKYFNSLVTSFHRHLNLNRHTVIEKDINDKLLKNLNLREKSSYNAVGADEAIFNIINNLILIKIPLFVERNLEQFYEISKSVSEDILNVDINDIGISIDRDKLSKFIKELFILDGKVSIIENKGFLIFNTYMKKYSNSKLNDFASYLHLRNISEIFENYNTEISTILKKLYISTLKNKKNILRISSGPIEKSFHNILDNILVKDLFDGVDKLDLNNIQESLIKIIEENDLLHLNFRAFINAFYNYLDERDFLDSLVDVNDINLSLNEIIKKLSKDSKFSNYAQELFSKIISNDLKLSIYMNFGYNTKKYFTEILTDGFYLAIRKNLNKIFNSINLNEITKEEIMGLSPQQYQEIYEVFWKNNYRNIIWIGLAGGIIGSNKFAGMAALAVGFLQKAVEIFKRTIIFIKGFAKKLIVKLKKKINTKKDDK